jgi:hypothetical protein
LAEAVDKTSSIASFGANAVVFPGTFANSVLYLLETFLRFGTIPTGSAAPTVSASSASRSTAAALTRIASILLSRWIDLPHFTK